MEDNRVNKSIDGLISIIIPVYNAERYLKKCLDSVTGQTYKTIEIICINDGSTDGSLSILKEYQQKDDRIVIIDKQNEGASIARNVALEVIRGEYLLFVDSDDWIELNTCKKALQVLSDENADLVMWPYVKEFSARSEKKEIFKEEKIVFESECVKSLHRRLFGLSGKELRSPENADALCTIWGKLYKTSYIKENDISFFDIKKIGSFEDGLFNIEVFQQLKKVVYINDYLYHYRKDNEQSVTTVYKQNFVEQRRCLFSWMREYIRVKECDEKYLLCLNNRIVFSVLDIGLNLLTSDIPKKQQKKELKAYVSSLEYRKAIKNFQFKYLKMHWKLFYWCAKHKNIVGLYMLLRCIKKIIGK